MRTFILGGLALCGFALGACTTPQRAVSLEASCKTYAIALRAATTLYASGRLSESLAKDIDKTNGPAQAVCSGNAPSTDAEAAQKVGDLVAAVLRATAASPALSK